MAATNEQCTKLIDFKKPRTILLVLSFFTYYLFLSQIALAADFAGSLKGITITDSGGENIPPSAVINFTQNGSVVNFDASEAADSDGSITTYQWDFGDGVLGEGKTAIHNYLVLDAYWVTLTVVDNSGAVTLTQTKVLNYGTCPSVPFVDVDTQNANKQLIASDSVAYVGGQYVGNDFFLCKAAFRVSSWVGDISAKNYEVRVYSMDGNDLGMRKANGVSVSISGTEILTNSDTYYNFEFNPPVHVKTKDAIVLTETSNNQAADSLNFVRVYISTVDDTDVNVGTWRADKTKTSLYATQSPAVKLYEVE